MSLSIFKMNGENFESDKNESPLKYGNGFKIKIAKNNYYTKHKNEIITDFGITTEDLNQKLEINGITEDEISFNFSTDWDSNGSSKLAQKVQSVLGFKFIKMLATQSNNGYENFSISDGWTQQKMKGSSPLTCNLKFKLFKDDSYIGSNYVDTIKLLMYICSPRKTPEIVDYIGSTLKNGIEGSFDVVKNVYEEIKNSFSNNTTDSNQIINAVSSFLNKIYKNTLTPAIIGQNNNNYTVTLSIGDKIKEKQYGIGDKFENADFIDWIITNFSYKPSTQFQTIDKIPYPLWIEFNVSLVTRLTLSNLKLLKLFK